MQVSLLQFAAQCYPGRREYVNHCIGEIQLHKLIIRSLSFDFKPRCVVVVALRLTWSSRGRACPRRHLLHALRTLLR